MSPRNRVVAYGSAALLIVAGVVCAVAVAGVTGGVLATVLIGGGMIALAGLAFYEVGLSEDRDRERQRRRARAPQRPRRRWLRPPRRRGH